MSVTEQQNDEPLFFEIDDDMPSMEELLGQDNAAEYGEGKLVTGKVIEKRDGGVLVDIGFKCEAFVPKEELPNWEEVALGDEVEAILEELENEHSMPMLSVEKAALQAAWDKFVAEHEEGGVVKGTIKYRVKGGLMVDVGVDAFLPGSQADITPVRNLDDLVGQEFEFKLLKINTERRNVVVSRRELLEEERTRERTRLLEEILPGQLRSGVVKNITDFGAFIDLRGIDGLIHITDMSWGRIAHPSELVNIGEELEAVILDVDRDKQRVSLGLKQKSSDPWETVDQKFPVGNRVPGRVVNVMPYGAFVEIEQGVEGLIHVSEMSWTKRVTRASDVLQVGEEVETMVLDIQREAKKISLGLRQTMENPWEAAAKCYPPGTKIKGKVRNMTSYGAFIQIEDDIDGMVHVSDMSWTRKINNPAEVLKKGEEVEALVLDINPKQQRISLGIKQLAEDPWNRINDLYSVGDQVEGVVTKLTNFGAFAELEHGIDGLIHISQLSEERVTRVKDIIKVGDKVQARVIKIDQAERRIGLSLRTSDDPQGGYPEEHDRDRGRDRRSDRDRDRRSDRRGGYAGGTGGALRPGEDMVDFGDVFDIALGETREQGPDEEDDD